MIGVVYHKSIAILDQLKKANLLKDRDAKPPAYGISKVAGLPTLIATRLRRVGLIGHNLVIQVPPEYFDDSTAIALLANRKFLESNE